MTYRPHRSHARYAPVAGPASPPRRRAQRFAGLLVQPAVRVPRPGALTGVLYGLPPALLMWAGLFAAAKAVF